MRRRNRETPALALAWSLAFALATGTASLAQAPGRLAGELQDPDGQPLEGVTIVLQAAETGVEVKAVTKKNGRFTLAVVDASKTFTIRLEKEGYQTLTEPVDIPVGDVLRASWTLQPAAGPAAAGPSVPDAPERGGGVSQDAVKAYNTGVTSLQANDLAAASASFEQAAQLAPEMPQAREILAEIYVQGGDYEKALSHAEALLGFAPDNVRGLGLKVDALAGLGRRDEAEAALDALLAKDNSADNAIRAYNSGVSALRAGDHDNAVRRFEQAVAIQPDLKEAHAAIGQVAVQRGDFAKALEHGQKLLELEPGNARALLVVYDAYRGLGQEEQAQEVFQQLQSADPATVVEAFMRQGQTLFEAGNAAEAVASFEKVIATNPDHARGHYHLALAYASAGDAAKAKEHLQRFVELAPDDPEVESAKAMLAELGG
jgi:tetratricopeptide (TPR) repeat protein